MTFSRKLTSAHVLRQKTPHRAQNVTETRDNRDNTQVTHNTREWYHRRERTTRKERVTSSRDGITWQPVMTRTPWICITGPGTSWPCVRPKAANVWSFWLRLVYKAWLPKFNSLCDVVPLVSWPPPQICAISSKWPRLVLIPLPPKKWNFLVRHVRSGPFVELDIWVEAFVWRGWVCVPKKRMWGENSPRTEVGHEKKAKYFQNKIQKSVFWQTSA